MKTPRSGRLLAWGTFALGVAVSVLGNIGHAAADGMKPGEWAGAAFWPTALMLSVEVLTRVRWQKERRWSLARFAGLVVVSVVSAVLSYLHLRGLLLYWGESPFQATIGPAAVDGMMLLAAAALLSISKERADAPVVVPEQKPEPDARAAAPAPKPEAKPSKLSIVHDVPESAPEDHARDLWLKSGRTLSAQAVADILGTSKSTAHRRIQAWSA